MVIEKLVGNGKVELLAGGGQVFADRAARFVASEKSLSSIIAAPYSPEIVANLLESGHMAALEFDYFLFGVEGYSRVCETQLVRKRMASYMIKSGRIEHKDRRAFSVVYPPTVGKFEANVILPNGKSMFLSGFDLASLVSQWYEAGMDAGLKEENLRYLKPQATEFKGIIGMNAHALWDFFGVRLCLNAQAEIRDLATKMFRLCRKAAPDLFRGCGPRCRQIGYCPEGRLQNVLCHGTVPTRKDMEEAFDALLWPMHQEYQ